MLLDPIDAPDERTAEDLLADYRDALADVVAATGVETAADATAIPQATLSALVAGEDPALTLDDACEILALTDDWSDADAVRLEIRDHLMLGMSSAIMDVDALERALDGEMTAKEIQAKIEGRHEMSLAEYAAVVLVVEREKEF